MAKRDESSKPPRPRPTDRPMDRPPDRPRVEDPKPMAPEADEPSVQPRSSEDLAMIPVQEEGEHEDLAPPPPPGATEFFAIDRPKPFVDETTPTRREKEVSQRAALFTPGRPAERPAPSPPPPSPAPPPPAPPPPAPGAALGIEGPIASAPGLPATPRPPAPTPPSPAGAPEPHNRTTSYRIYVVLLALFSVVALSVMVTVGIIAAVVILDRDEEPAPVAKPVPEPPPSAPSAAPVFTPAPDVAVTPPPDPEPATPATGPVTIHLAPGAPRFVSLRIDCEEPSFRDRQRFDGGSVTVPDVPRSNCTASFLGGLPARTTIRGGQTRTCRFDGANAICE